MAFGIILFLLAFIIGISPQVFVLVSLETAEPLARAKVFENALG